MSNNTTIVTSWYTKTITCELASYAAIHLYTGFSNYNTLKICYDFLCKSVDQLNCWGSSSTSSDNQGTYHAISPLNDFFLVLCRIRCGLLQADLSYQLQISQSTVSRIIITWKNVALKISIYGHPRNEYSSSCYLLHKMHHRRKWNYISKFHPIHKHSSCKNSLRQDNIVHSKKLYLIGGQTTKSRVYSRKCHLTLHLKKNRHDLSFIQGHR